VVHDVVGAAADQERQVQERMRLPPPALYYAWQRRRTFGGSAVRSV
jgi:hypothetical protein